MELLKHIREEIRLPLSMYKHKDIAIELCSREEFIEFISKCKKYEVYGMNLSIWDNNVNDYTVESSLCVEYRKDCLRFCDKQWYERKHMHYRVVKYDEVDIQWRY